MKKKFLPILLSLLLVLSLAACGGSAGGGDSGGNAGSWSKDSTISTDSGPGGWEAEGGDYDAPESTETGADASAGTLPANTKVIYSADITLETKEFDSAEQAISRIVESLGG